MPRELKSFIAGFLALVAQASIRVLVAAGPTATRGDNANSATPPSMILKPVPHPDNGFLRPLDWSLARQENFFWTHEGQGLLANLSVVAADGYRILNGYRFHTAVESVDCSASASASTITIRFRDAESLSAARDAWSWVDDSPDNRAVYVVDDGACGGQDGRQPYYVDSMDYGTGSNSAVLATSPAKWKEFAAEANIRLHSAGTESVSVTSSPDGPGPGPPEVEGDALIDLSHDFGGPLFSSTFLGGGISVECSDCKTTGGIDADITIDLINGLEASVVAVNNLGVRFAVAVTASGSVTAPLKPRPLKIVSFPLAGISIRHIVQLGPAVDISAEIAIKRLYGRATTTEIGAAVVIPNGQSWRLGQPHSIAPEWSLIGPRIDDFVAATIVASPIVALSLAGTFLGRGVIGGISIAAPNMTADIGAAVRTDPGGGCPGGGGNGKSGVSYRLNAGFELDAFAGFGSGAQQPNRTLIFQTNRDVLDGCISINL